MNSLLLTLVSSLTFGSIAFANPEAKIMDCGVLKDRKGAASKSAPHVVIVARKEKFGGTTMLVKETRLGHVDYQTLVIVSRNNNATAYESRNYRLVEMLRIGKATITKKAKPEFSSECKRSPNRIRN